MNHRVTLVATVVMLTGFAPAALAAKTLPAAAPAVSAILPGTVNRSTLSMRATCATRGSSRR